jgi:hypothetical protein
MTTVYTLNRSPTSGVEGRTLYEALYRTKPSMHHLRVFGCIAYMKIMWPHLAKLDDKRIDSTIQLMAGFMCRVMSSSTRTLSGTGMTTTWWSTVENQQVVSRTNVGTPP